MKIRIVALSLLAIATIFVIAQSLPISLFPNVSTPLDSDLFVLAQTQAPKTNKNIRYDQLRGSIRSGMATETYVNSVSNAAAGAGSNLVVVLTGTNTYVTKTSTNGTNFYTIHGDKSVVLSGTNTHVVNTFTNGTNFYAVNSAGSSETVLWTNSGGIVMLTTNGPVSIASTGLLGGLVVTQDIRFLGHNSASNSVWVCTNATTGEGEWRASTAAAGFGGVMTNSDTLNLQYGPVRGSTWYSGTNGIPTTNEARAGMEFSPFWRSLRMGEVASGADFLGVVGNGSNYWNNTNIGPCTVGFGSNSFVKGAFSSVLGGAYNHIMTGSVYCVIAGGSDNYIRTNVDSSSILGGTKNRIDTENFGGGFAGNSVIAGGTNNQIVGASRGSFIGAGEANVVKGPNSAIVSGKSNQITETNGGFNFIGSGESHLIGDAIVATSVKYATICGGFSHLIDAQCDYSFIGGGNDNAIGTTCTNGVIVGGAFNTIGTTSAKFGFISGGERNFMNGNYNFIIGTSNEVGGSAVNRSGAIGVGVTNDTSNTIMMGYGHLNGKVKVRAATNATVGGIVMSTTTTVASAGAAETNLISVTIPAHTLTNSQDRITFRTSGRFAATSNAKQLKVVYGSETILDGTSQVQNTGAWTIEGEIIRTGDTSQSVNAELHCAMTNGMTTTASLNLVQTNGINTTLKVTSTAAGDGDVTNRTMTVWLWPAP